MAVRGSYDPKESIPAKPVKPSDPVPAASSQETVITDQDEYRMVHAYGVLLGHDYKTYEESVAAQLSKIEGVDGGGAISAIKAADADGFITDRTEYAYKSPSVSDATIGGNDVINPHAAFALDDDIVHDIYTNNGKQFGMGRCYSEIYNSTQQVLYLTMGVPKYRNLSTWLKNATNKELADMNENGRPNNFSILGTLLSGVKLAIELPWLPILWTARLVDSVKTTPVTEYFMFRDSQALYYRYCNTLLSHIAVAMGIYGSGAGANMPPDQSGMFAANTPSIMKYGPDILKIMSRRSERLGKGIMTSTDQELQNMKKYNEDPAEKVEDVFTKFWSGLKMGALEGANFIGFRIERADNANETFNNSTQESSLANKLNAEVAKIRSYSTGEANGTGALAWARQKIKQVSNLADAFKNLASGQLENTIAYLAAGNGYFDLPKQWAGSSGISRSMTFSFKLRSKTGGDNVSIYQSIMVPLVCMLAAALPHAVGDTTFSSPFIVRAFCRGMFSIPAGIISSLSVTRGSSEFGWTKNRLPTVVDVTMTIEDLSPMIFLSLAGNGPFQQAFVNNTKMHEYLNTLTGIGLKERYFIMGRIKRNIKAGWLVARNTWFNPTYWGYHVGDSTIVRAVMALTPFHRVPNN